VCHQYNFRFDFGEGLTTGGLSHGFSGQAVENKVIFWIQSLSWQNGGSLERPQGNVT
jgi:hypothetical protein